MKVTKIKTELHQSIENIDFLKAIQIIIDSKKGVNSSEPELTKKQIAGLKSGLKKIKEGRVVPDRSVQNFFDECLKK